MRLSMWMLADWLAEYDPVVQIVQAQAMVLLIGHQDRMVCGRVQRRPCGNGGKIADAAGKDRRQKRE